VCLLALAKHVTVGGGNGQRSGWHLADPKVGGQGRARVRDVSPRSGCGTSSSVLSKQSGDGCHDQHACGGEYGAPWSAEIAHGNDQAQQDDQDCEDRP
jgi:hypothetical protein